MCMKGAFIFLAPGAKNEHNWVKTSQVHLLSMAVQNYDEAVEAAKRLADSGIGIIELCAGNRESRTTGLLRQGGDVL